ncbi:amino acid transporter [Rhizobium sp. S-51]|uniref:Amino acid transporter n=1 Tax=Rhizobium terricola TaxID=2728849 RepID=A0A7Y0AT64_9HYPH|nr:LysE/ArgO family amino acid transporter [Rhizobium terricola]NML73056.1 amino acid transporter [Rhizobium terricola]
MPIAAPPFTAAIAGFLLGLSLIVAIGAQNAFVLRQGLRRRHVFAIALTCAVSDALLIAAGVGGLGRAIGNLPWLMPILRYGGAAFLFYYGFRALRAAIRGGETLTTHGEAEESLATALVTCLALTWLNPHVYLDTVVLLGSISTQYPGQGLAFGTGAATASFLFFFSLAYGARLLRPLFARPASWRILDALIALVMASIATNLVWIG